MFTWLKSFWSWLTHANVTEEIQAVQDLTVKACSFLPTAATVGNIIAAGNPQLLTATAIATAVCTAVSSRANSTVMGLVAAEPMVAGVKIEGTFVTKEN